MKQTVNRARLQRFVDLDIALQHFGQKLGEFDATLFRLGGEVLPNAHLNPRGHEYPRAGRHVVKTTDPLAEIDLGGDVAAFAWLLAIGLPDRTPLITLAASPVY